jgi:hypothetical protein
VRAREARKLLSSTASDPAQHSHAQYPAGEGTFFTATFFISGTNAVAMMKQIILQV